jgi:hypothetical protein
MIIVITASGKFTEQAVQDLITDFFAPYIGQEFSIEEQGAEHQFIVACTEDMDDPIPVYDLAKGLYPVTRMALDGSESDPKPRTDQGTGNHTKQQSDGSASFSEQLADWTLEELKELENDLHHAIRVKENFHTTYTNGTKDQPVIDPVGLIDRINAENPDRIKCWKSARGKVRKAGKSKARPGETEIWMTEDEFSNL